MERKRIKKLLKNSKSSKRLDLPPIHPQIMESMIKIKNEKPHIFNSPYFNTKEILSQTPTFKKDGVNFRSHRHHQLQASIDLQIK